MAVPATVADVVLNIVIKRFKNSYTWKTHKIVFVNSMSDLFHEDIPLEFIQRVFKVMNENPQHVFQILTKRAEYLFKYHKKSKLDA